MQSYHDKEQNGNPCCEGKAEKKVEEHKQQLVAEPTLEPVSDLVELEEVVEDEDDQ